MKGSLGLYKRENPVPISEKSKKSKRPGDKSLDPLWSKSKGATLPNGGGKGAR